MISTIAAIAIGGALGAVARYGANLGAVALLGQGFPWGTLSVNILGSFIMGALVSYFALQYQPSEPVKLMLLTGFLGAFTTFSAFSLDVSVLWERGNMLGTGGYIAASVIASIGALFLGMALIRSLLT